MHFIIREREARYVVNANAVFGRYENLSRTHEVVLAGYQTCAVLKCMTWQVTTIFDPQLTSMAGP
jgi:hypothetical protein